MTQEIHYINPPVVETVASVQFAPLPMSPMHVGWYWSEFLREKWPITRQDHRLDDQFERFGSEQIWNIVGGLQIQTSIPFNRIQISSATNDRMIQIQDSRFIYNWQKANEAYPRYKLLISEFKEQFEKFSRFMATHSIGKITPNQWEVTYVNHIVKGNGWENSDDWHSLFPSLFPRSESGSMTRLEGINAQWSMTLNDNLGRLYINLHRAKLGSVHGPEALVVSLTSRGPVNDKMNLFDGLDFGHDAIVETFDEIASDQIKSIWNK